MAAFSILRPEEIGWDPTMRLYCSPTVTHIPYLIDFDIKNYSSSVYHTHWAIDILDKKGNTRETFITVGCLSATQADGGNPRGTVIWEAVKEKELGDPKEVRSYYVLNFDLFPTRRIALCSQTVLVSFGSRIILRGGSVCSHR